MHTKSFVNRVGRGLAFVLAAGCLVWTAQAGEFIRIGEPTLILEGSTLAEVQAGELVGKTLGSYLLPGDIKEYNVTVVASEGNRPTKLRAEFQVIDAKLLKCVVVEFTEGWGGVWAVAVEGRYQPVPPGGVGSVRFVNPDGSYNGQKGPLAQSEAEIGYGVSDLKLTPRK